MAIKKPKALTGEEETELEQSITIGFEQFKAMIGPNVEYIDTYLHYGIGLDAEQTGVEERTKYASVYGLLDTGGSHPKGHLSPDGSPVKYERFFFWHGQALYTATMLSELFELIVLYFRQSDLYAFSDAASFATYKAGKAKEAAEKEQAELLAAVKKAEKQGLCKAIAKGKKAA